MGEKRIRPPNKILPLTHLEFRVFLADDVHAPLAAYDLAVFAAFFDRCSDFHRVLLFSLSGSAPPVCVLRRFAREILML